MKTISIKQTTNNPKTPSLNKLKEISPILTKIIKRKDMNHFWKELRTPLWRRNSINLELIFMAIFIRDRKRRGRGKRRRRLVGVVGRIIAAEIFRGHLCHSILVKKKIKFRKRKVKLRKRKKKKFNKKARQKRNYSLKNKKNKIRRQSQLNKKIKPWINPKKKNS